MEVKYTAVEVKEVVEGEVATVEEEIVEIEEEAVGGQGGGYEG